MKFLETKLPGVWLIALEPFCDDRGFLARTYCQEEFAFRGLNTAWPQCNLTLTAKRGMIRGLHFQAEPKPEIKLVRCAAGAILDVLVDLREASPQYGKWERFELTSRNRHMLYVPAGIAHGFQCMEDNSEVFYQMSEFYHPSLARGVRWNDPALAISWPVSPAELSDKDWALPLLSELT